MDEDYAKDYQARKFLDELMKVGPSAKHILNYSYPPLLYQRGDGDDDEDDDNEDLEDDDAAVRDILEGGNGDDGPGGLALPDFGDEYEDDMDDDEDDDGGELMMNEHELQQLIDAGVVGPDGNINNAELYKKIK